MSARPRKKHKQANGESNDGANHNRDAYVNHPIGAHTYPSPQATKKTDKAWYQSGKVWWRVFEFLGIIAGIVYMIVTVLTWWQHRKDDRPYLVFQTMRGKSHITAIGDVVSINAEFQNTGRGTAYDVRSNGCLIPIRRADLQDASTIAISNRMYNALRGRKTRNLIDTAPTGSFTSGAYLSPDDKCIEPHPNDPHNWSDTLDDKFRSGEISLIGLTVINYRGDDGPHETQVCAIYSGQTIDNPRIDRMPNFCPTHNTVR